MSLTLLNQIEELNSFPVTQKIFLKSASQLESSDFKNTILLFDIPRKDALLNLAKPHSFNLGLVSRQYQTVSLDYRQVPVDNYYTIEVTPQKPLELSSSYLLYIDSALSTPFVIKNKLVSKSNSDIIVSVVSSNVNRDILLNIKILSTSKITSNSNHVKIELTYDGSITTKVLNLFNSDTIELNQTIIQFPSKVYLEGEEFNFVIQERYSVDNSPSTYIINTVDDLKIFPRLNTQETSSEISNQDILDFYNNVDTPPVEVTYDIVYTDLNQFEIRLPAFVNKLDVDINNVKANISKAFNNYLIQNLGLYEDSNKYLLKLIWDEDSKSILVVVLYNEDSLVNDRITVDLGDW